LLEKSPQSITPVPMTYHLRRLRLHGLIGRVPKSHRYRVDDLVLQNDVTIPCCAPAWRK